MVNVSIGLLLFTATPAMAQLKAPGPANNVTDTGQGLICSLETESALPKGKDLARTIWGSVPMKTATRRLATHAHQWATAAQSGNDLAVAVLLPPL